MNIYEAIVMVLLTTLVTYEISNKWRKASMKTVQLITMREYRNVLTQALEVIPPEHQELLKKRMLELAKDQLFEMICNNEVTIKIK